MKALKKQIGRIRSHIASRDSSPVPAERSDNLDMQTGTIPSDESDIRQTQSKDTGALPLETQHIDDSDTPEGLVSDSDPISLEPRAGDSSVPNVQTNTPDITNIMQHVDPALMEKFGRFRVLIIGRANAGKTTVLQRICNSTEDPEIYNDKGEKVWFTKLGHTRY